MFTQDYMLQAVLVKGEVSNCKYHSSGHIYFTLKDSKTTMNCVMFAGNRAGLTFRLAEGQQVIAGGTIDVYERDGKYQLYARQIALDGAGLYYERFEQLKKELEELGMFAQEYKQPIPRYIHTLGVVTADTGAAVRDIIQITRRRNPYVQIILYPATVQGEHAAESIVNGIRALEALQVDVMIVGRGGGSIEDLWAFNERIVAQAVFDCSIPIISAVGLLIYALWPFVFPQYVYVGLVIGTVIFSISAGETPSWGCITRASHRPRQEAAYFTAAVPFLALA